MERTPLFSAGCRVGAAGRRPASGRAWGVQSLVPVFLPPGPAGGSKFLCKKKTKKIKHPLCERQENRTWKASHRVNMTAWVPNAWQPLLSGEQWLVAGILAVSQLLTSAGNCVPTPHPPRDLGTPLASSYFLPSSQRLREVSPPVSVCVCHLSPPPSAPLKCKTHH